MGGQAQSGLSPLYSNIDITVIYGKSQIYNLSLPSGYKLLSVTRRLQKSYFLAQKSIDNTPGELTLRETFLLHAETQQAPAITYDNLNTWTIRISLIPGIRRPL